MGEREGRSNAQALYLASSTGILIRRRHAAAAKPSRPEKEKTLLLAEGAQYYSICGWLH